MNAIKNIFLSQILILQNREKEQGIPYTPLEVHFAFHNISPPTDFSRY
jgi:hypothetical protein